MKLNHIAIAAKDIASAQAFYREWFGFQEARGPGFLMNADGFVLVIDQASEAPTLPEWFHFGFHLASRGEVRALYDRMKGADVPIAVALDEGPTTVFFCKDPSGFLIEVRSTAGA